MEPGKCRSLRCFDGASSARVESRAVRLAPTLLVLTLLAASAAAFAVAERLKLEASPILGPKVERAFSPGCRCPYPTAELRFRLARRDRLTVTVLDARGRKIRTLADALPRPRGRVVLRWDGKTDSGTVVRDGRYRYVVKLLRKARTVKLPFPVTADRTPPVVKIVSALPRTLLAGSRGHAGRVKIRYRLSERARPVILFRGRRAVRARRRRPRGQLDWYARSAGKALGPGVYRLTIEARDTAGNLSAPAMVNVEIRPRV